jgi:amidohydrolase
MDPSLAEAPSFAETLVGWRRHLHANPEISCHERATADFVAARLAELGVPHVRAVGGHGVVASLSRGRSNRSVGLRADMDALAITETTGLPYASTNPGVMHACGHDGHTASLLGAAALLARDDSWTGTIHLVFQPAEEGLGGAAAMLEDGLLERFPMERIFAIHNWPGLAAGTVAIHDGVVMAGGARVEIVLDGKSGHAAMPHLTRDPILAAGHLLVALQSAVSRNVDPLAAAVLSICTIEGGVATNQIPARVTMRGTIRSFDAAVGAVLEAAIHRITQGIAAGFGVTAHVVVQPTVGATLNSKAEADLAAAACAAASIPCRRDLPPSMGSEDFSFLLARRPGAYVWIGNGPSRDLHNDGYDFNDAILPTAAAYLAAVAKQALERDSFR